MAAISSKPVLLALGVTVMQAQTLSPYLGFGNEFSISGSRSNGQGEYMDGTDIQGFPAPQHGSGSGVLGTTLGVDAIAEFEVLTNTYGAQYGGNGGVVNSVTRSGTNNFHGSVYEFLRNSALDARNFFDPAQIPAFRKNQFGGTFGGPIKKDKMFFFINYEGIQQSTGETRIADVPDAAAHSGFVPVAGVETCVNKTTIAFTPANLGACAATISATVQPYINFCNNYALPTSDLLSGGSNPDRHRNDHHDCELTGNRKLWRGPLRLGYILEGFRVCEVPLRWRAPSRSLLRRRDGAYGLACGRPDS